MKKNNFLPTIVLSAICVIVAGLLAVTNVLTTAVIERAEKEKTAEALRTVYPNGEEFEAVDISALSLPEELTEVYSVSDGGYVFKASVTGYKSGLVIMCGVDANGKITDSRYIESQETNGAEDKLDGAYNGASLDGLKVETVGGSTKTSKGYHRAIEASLEGFAILNSAKGGTEQ